MCVCMCVFVCMCMCRRNCFEIRIREGLPFGRMLTVLPFYISNLTRYIFGDCFTNHGLRLTRQHRVIEECISTHGAATRACNLWFHLAQNVLSSGLSIFVSTLLGPCEEYLYMEASGLVGRNAQALPVQPASDLKPFTLKFMETVQGPFYEAIEKIESLQGLTDIETVVLVGHGGLDSFMGALLCLQPEVTKKKKKVIIFTCNSQVHELGKELSDMLRGSNSVNAMIEFIILDTYAKPNDMKNTIKGRLKGINFNKTLFVNGESGADILSPGSLKGGYCVENAANMDFYEDYGIPKILHDCYPDQKQFLVLTNPGLDISKGAASRLKFRLQPCHVVGRVVLEECGVEKR